MKRNIDKKAMTFADVYRKRLQVQRTRSSVSTAAAGCIDCQRMDNSRLQQDLFEFSSAIQNNPILAMIKMKEVLESLPKQLHHSFMHWMDSRDMDVLHHCIIFNKPDIINLILENRQIFPEDFCPTANPYAHLAAFVGNLECLEALLTLRPGFYFKTSKPQHAIQIQKDLMLRIRKEGNSSVNKHIHKLLKKVGADTTSIEMAEQLKQVDVDALDKEMSSMQTFESRMPKHGKPKPSVTGVLFDTRDNEKKKKGVTVTTDQNKEHIHDIRRCPHIIQKGSHIITVFMESLDDEVKGVIRGAGPAVKLLAPNERVNMLVPKLPGIGESLRVLKEKSRAMNRQRGIVQTLKSDSKSRMNMNGISYYNIVKDKGNKTNNAAPPGSKEVIPSKSSSYTSDYKKIEMGVRTIKKYKDFRLQVDSKKTTFRDDKYLNKTPLTVAAEKGHLDCVQYLLQKFLLKQHPTLTWQEPLTLATKAQSPEAIAILLTGKYSRDDYQSAILTALREFYPACLTVLLNGETKDRHQLFDRENLFHILFSQSLNSDFRYELMPKMTSTLINCREEVNAHGPGCSHPMYTLITCAFNIKGGQQCMYYLDCLKILLNAKANPHYNEMKAERNSKSTRLTLSRQLYYSAIHCVFANAQRSLNFFQKPYWSKFIMHKFVECIVTFDKTPRRILNDVLFCYMDYVCQLGLERRVLKWIFRYGANPDFNFGGKYAINRFFDEVLPYLSQFEVKSQVDGTIDALMMLCHSMSQECLQEAFMVFLDDHLLHTPVQALPLTRRFCYEVNVDLKRPRSLIKLSGDVLWKQVRRNPSNVWKLPANDNVLNLIIP